MNSRTKLLSALTVLLFIGSLAAGSVSGSYGLLGTINDEQVIPAETYGDDRRNDAVSILIQTQFVDTRANHEWDKVMSSLIGSLYGKFTYDNLTDYTQLSSMIDEYDVLLIPENEDGSFESSNMIAAAWSSFLPTWVENGGTVICMDYANVTSDYGITSQILNATGLMDIYNPTSAFGHQIDLKFTFDALARNIPGSYSGLSGSICFDTWDGVKVMEDATNNKAVVVHKTMGKGHVVMLGFDMWTVNTNQDRLLANAIRLQNHVMFDYSHTQDMSIYVGLSYVANATPYEGFAVSQMNFFSAQAVNACDILVITTCVDVYSPAEVTILDNFVNSGGSLLIATEVSIWGLALDPLLEHFGYERKVGFNLNDTDDYHDDVSYVDLYPENLNMHSTKVGVDVVEVHGSSAFITTPESAVPILTTDDDGTAWWSSTIHDSEPADGLPIATVDTIGEGRIAFLADNSLYCDYDHDSDGSPDYLDADNALFMDNLFRWLAGAGIPEQTVVFDYSKSPWGYLHSTLQPLAEFLMFNGYNVIWTEDFNPLVYDEADILFICDGSFDYNTSEIAYIESYVADGGALLLWGDFVTACQQVDPIAQEFGLQVNTTGYLRDIDDYVDNTAYVIYDGANIGTHPIMDGIDRIEVSASTGFISIGSGTALVSTDGDGTSNWGDGSPADNLAVYAATTYNKGRVAFITDQNLGGPTDSDSDGFPALYDADNPIFVANVFKWLAENRAPTVDIITPNGGEVINGTITINWDAVDFDSDPMTYDVYFSDNNGSDWTSLASDLALPEFEWNTTQHDDGTDYMIRVIASDGILSAQDESDARFELDNIVGGGSLPIDLMWLLLIIAGIIIIVIVIVIVRKKGGKGKGKGRGKGKGKSKGKK